MQKKKKKQVKGLKKIMKYETIIVLGLEKGKTYADLFKEMQNKKEPKRSRASVFLQIIRKKIGKAKI